MSRRVFHLLTETDSFSDVHGAALQRWVANVLRFESSKSVVVCARADATWGLPNVIRRTVPGLLAYSYLKGRYRLPWRLRGQLLRKILTPALSDLRPGDVVWVHNRPDYAGAIHQHVRSARARLVVHLHNSLLVSFPRPITTSFEADHLVFCSEFLASQASKIFPRLSRFSVLHNGADETRFFPSRVAQWASSRPLVVIFAGRLVPEKGAHIFFEAMRILRRRHIPALGRVFGASGFGSSHRTTAYVRSLLNTRPENVDSAAIAGVLSSLRNSGAPTSSPVPPSGRSLLVW